MPCHVRGRRQTHTHTHTHSLYLIYINPSLTFFCNSGLISSAKMKYAVLAFLMGRSGRLAVFVTGAISSPVAADADGVGWSSVSKGRFPIFAVSSSTSIPSASSSSSSSPSSSLATTTSSTAASASATAAAGSSSTSRLLISSATARISFLFVASSVSALMMMATLYSLCLSLSCK